MAQPRKQRPFGDEIIKITGSVIHWDTICHQIMGDRDNRLAVLVTCANCGQDRWVPVHNLDSRKAEGKFFTGCCNHCARKLAWREKRRTQPLHRRPTSNGYIKLYLPDNPMADKRGEIYEHRFVISEMLGRPLETWETVHHKGTKYPIGSREDKADNREDNLELHPNTEHITITRLQVRVKQLEDILKQKHIPIPR